MPNGSGAVGSGADSENAYKDFCFDAFPWAAREINLVTGRTSGAFVVGL